MQIVTSDSILRHMKKKSTPKTSIGRRDFLKKSATGVASLSLASCATFEKADEKSERSPAGIGSATVGSHEQFEFIVVGSGAGGGPLACNLAKKGYKVLLLEAGGIHNGANSKIPAFHPKSTEDAEMAWNFYVKHYGNETRASKDSKYVPGKGILYPRAATLGGCTAHNAMITMYPDNSDFDDIVKRTGDKSWNSVEMRNHFMRLERNRYTTSGPFNLARQGFNGWLDTTRADIGVALNDYDLRAIISSTVGEQNLVGDFLNRVVAEAGNFPPDTNRWQYVLGKSNGIFNVPVSQYKGVRSGPREYILETLKQTNNLRLKTNALAKRILFTSNDASRAIGVEYYDGAALYSADPRNAAGSATAAPVRQVFATREVILAGGAFNSPQLLMLSGIGDPQELQAAGVQGPYIPLPGVGKNLQDRYEVGVVSELGRDLALTKDCTFGGPGDPCLKDYVVNPEKSVYSLNGVLISLVRRSSWGKSDPDICIFGLPGHFAGYYPGYAKNVFNSRQFSWAVLKGHTHNTGGRVRLKSANAFDTPEINFNFFDEGNGNWEDDLAGVVEGVRIARRMNGTLTGRGIVKTELLPGPGVDSSDKLREYIMREAWGHHASCSNKMGTNPDGEEQAVVDSHFRVHKTKGLRIVDASVFPKIPGLFIALPIYMIAEKAAETIVKDIGV